MHTIKILLTYYLNISVQAANLSDCRIESNRKNRFGSENRIESNRNFFCPNWNALLPSPHQLRSLGRCKLTQWGPRGRRYGKCSFGKFTSLKNQVISTFHSWLAVLSFHSCAKIHFCNRWGSVDPTAPLNDAPGRLSSAVNNAVEIYTHIAVDLRSRTASCVGLAASRVATHRRPCSAVCRLAVAVSQGPHADDAYLFPYAWTLVHSTPLNWTKR